jgi:hypothetical protein
MGKLKGKIVSAGSANGMLRYKNENGEKVEIPYDQAFPKELGLEPEGTVHFDLITVDGKPMGVAVEAVDKGEVASINGNGGTIIEKDSGRSYDFQQNYLSESKIAPGSPVEFKLVSVSGKMVATCVSVLGQ